MSVLCMRSMSASGGAGARRREVVRSCDPWYSCHTTSSSQRSRYDSSGRAMTSSNLVHVLLVHTVGLVAYGHGLSYNTDRPLVVSTVQSSLRSGFSL